MKVVVTSTNPVKVSCVRAAFERVFKTNIDVRSIKVESQVGDQPTTEEDTLKGAQNRNRNAIIKLASQEYDYLVSIEAGIQTTKKETFSFAWILIEDKNSKQGKARTGTYVIPEKLVDLTINKGVELGEANDIVFGTSNSKQKGGAIGILTNNIITRKMYYEEATVMALIPFIKPELY